MDIKNIFKKKQKEPSEKEQLIAIRKALTAELKRDMDADERGKLIKDICAIEEQIAHCQELEDNKKSKRADRAVSAAIRGTEIGVGAAIPIYLIGKEHQFEQLGDYMTSQTAKSTINKMFDTFKYVAKH